MSFLLHRDWTYPVPIAYGPGRIGQIAKFCAQHGLDRPLVVTDRGSAALPFIADLLERLDQAGLGRAIYSDISPNPRDDEIADGRALYRERDHDGIIAIGGGSGMDGGKAIALTANNDIPLFDFEYTRKAPDLSGAPAFPKLICVPTTAGTGAETESTAMITDTTRMMKWCIWHEALKPAVAILDPELTLGLPPHLTAWTGTDAMVHAMEAYCVPDLHPLCDAMALEGLRLIAGALSVAVAEPTNLEARGALMIGSCMAGIAFLKGLGLVHAISHMIGAEYDTQHGLTNAVLLPAVLRYNAPDIAHKVGPMAQAVGLTDTRFEALHDWTCATLDEIGIPKTLAEIGVPDDCVERIAAKSLEDSAAETNPRSSTAKDIEAVIRDALSHGR